MVEAAFDDVAMAVVLGVEPWRSSTAGAAALPVGGLVGGFGDDGADPPSAICRASRKVLPRLPVRAGNNSAINDHCASESN